MAISIFDAINLFPRLPGGPTPFLVVDGHQSRLDPDFIEYINDEKHRWVVCFGVPYATTLFGSTSAGNLVQSDPLI